MLAMQISHRGKIREYAPDLVIGTVPALPTSVVTMLTARIIGAPYIIDLRDAWPELLREKTTGTPAQVESLFVKSS